MCKNKIIYILLSKKIQTIFSVLSILIVNKNFFRVARVFTTESLIDLIGQLFFSRFLWNDELNHSFRSDSCLIQSLQKNDPFSVVDIWHFLMCTVCIVETLFWRLQAAEETAAYFRMTLSSFFSSCYNFNRYIHFLNKFCLFI